MIRTAFKSATVIAGFVLLGSSTLHAADSFGPSSDWRHGRSRPSVKTYATGLTNPRGLDLRSGPESLRRGGRHWRHVDADGRRRLPGRHQYLQPLHGRLQRPRHPRAAQWHEADSRRQSAQHDRQHRRQLRPDRCRLHRSHALRVDRDGRLLARAARTTCPQFFGSTAMARPPLSPTSTRGTRTTRRTSSRTPIRRPPTRSRAACSTR